MIARTSLTLVALFGALTACTGGAPVAASYKIESVIGGLDHPWGLAWLPDQTPLITLRGGSLIRLVNGRKVEVEMEGLPPVFASGQGGLMDIALHPKFKEKPWVYLTLSTGTGGANRTVLVRGVWKNGKIEGIKQIFRVSHDKNGAQHFGSRLLFLPDGSLLMSIGDGGNPPIQADGELSRHKAQKPSSHIGKVLRLKEDGTGWGSPALTKKPGGLPEIWTVGHRNIQGMALDRATGKVYATEHGARGGDELNLITGGKNYGWHLATFSREYVGPKISDHTSLPGMEDPITQWTPCLAPSGLSVYRGSAFQEWQGDLFAGALVFQEVRRIRLSASGQVAEQETIKIGQRVRDVREGPDGSIYVLTDETNGQLLRIRPK